MMNEYFEAIEFDHQLLSTNKEATKFTTMEKIKLIYRTDNEGNFHGVSHVNDNTINSFGHTIEDCIGNMRIAIEAFEYITDVQFDLQETCNVTTAQAVLIKYIEDGKINKDVLHAMQEYAKAKCAEQRQLIEELLHESVDVNNLPEPKFH